MYVYSYIQITIITFGWVKPFLALFQKTPVRSVPVDKDTPYHRAAPVPGQVLIYRNDIHAAKDWFPDESDDDLRHV